jgi:outer membrane receptor protein involved in Fe transport
LPWQGNLQLAWDRAEWSVQWSARYFDSYCLLTSCAEGPVTLSQASTSVPSQLYHDLSVRYRFAAADNTLLDNTEIRVGATNVFNKKPPIDLGSLAFYSTYGDPRLASYSISLRKAF